MWVGRVATVALIVLASLLALLLENALQAFQILLQIGAGTGSVFLLRWFWWRVNAWSELSAMIVSFLVAVYFSGLWWSVPAWDPSLQLVVGVFLTTVGWLVVTFLTPPADTQTLRDFYDLIRPLGPGWRGAGFEPHPASDRDSLSAAFLAWFLGCVVVYGTLFGTGYTLYGRSGPGVGCLAVAAVAAFGLLKTLGRVGIR